jgi:hypothetical protein
MIMNGKAPTSISGVPKVASSLAITRSQASARPSAPASTWPRAAQTTGLPSSPIMRKRRGKRSVPACFSTSAASAEKPDRSAPAENTRSCEEARTRQRTAGSSRAASRAPISSPSSAGESALRFSGVSSTMRATPASPTS